MQKIFIVLFKIFWVVEMMSREQLEEIREIDQEVGNGFAIEDLDLNTMTVVNREHFNWLIEQAERVQELERINKQLKNNLSVYKGYYKNTLKSNKDIVEENKKYREGIDEIMKCVNEHLSDGTEINPYKIDDIIDEIEGVEDV